jgi:hypothetical protein
MRERRCYATTGAHIRLHAALDGKPMGADVVRADDLRLQIDVEGTAELTAVELVTAGNVERIALSAPTCAIERLISPRNTPYLYVRVIQADHDMAWASPWFFDR